MAYVEVVELQRYAGIENDGHNALLSQLIDRAQKYIEEYVGFAFTASAASDRYFDSVEDVDGLTLYLDTWCYSISTVTNGDSTEIDSDYYVTQPRNDAPYYAIKLKPSSGYTWEPDSNNDNENAITISGYWCYSTTVPEDIKHATLRLALWYYRQRDNSTDMDRPLLAEGVTILPSAVPADVIEILKRYKWRGV